MPLPSSFDIEFFPVVREFTTQCRSEFLRKFVSSEHLICDIGSQGKVIAELQGYNVRSLDITEEHEPDIVADITLTNKHIPPECFDIVLCTDVLEHVVDPFAAVKEIRRMLKLGGLGFFSTPLNSRIHGPVPDCWRFTEFGLKVMFRDFELVSFQKLETPDRNLFPLQYCLTVKNTGIPETDPRSLIFSRID